MTCEAFLHISYSKELEEKIKKIVGIPDNNKYKDFDSIRISERMFVQHKKDVEAHKIPKNRRHGILGESEEWEYKGHGFEIWFNFEGDIVFVAGCHWNSEHGDVTIDDFKKWIKENLGDVEIKKEYVE